MTELIQLNKLLRKIKKNLTEPLFQKYFIGLTNINIVTMLLQVGSKKNIDLIKFKLSQFLRNDQKANFILNRLGNEYVNSIELVKKFYFFQLHFILIILID